MSSPAAADGGGEAQSPAPPARAAATIRPTAVTASLEGANGTDLNGGGVREAPTDVVATGVTATGVDVTGAAVTGVAVAGAADPGAAASRAPAAGAAATHAVGPGASAKIVAAFGDAAAGAPVARVAMVSLPAAAS